MSGKISNDGDLYAVVNKVKKKKVLGSQTLDSGLPTYDVVDNSKKSNATSEMSSYDVITQEVGSKNQLDASEGETYSKIDICPDNNFIYSTRNKNKEEKTRKKKIAGSVILMVVLVLVVSVLFLCVIIALAQNSSLKSEILLLQSVQPVSNNTSDYLAGKISQLENTTRYLSSILGPIGQNQNHPAISCDGILRLIPSSPSGYYWIRSSIGSAVYVYCDMNQACGFAGAWTRVTELNFSNTSVTCPSGFMQDGNIMHSCVPSEAIAACFSTQYSPNKIKYSKVCGRVKGYGDGSLDGFYAYSNSERVDRSNNIDDNYVDGVSLTHGMNPRQHIWTFAAIGTCPCSKKPMFVANEYFCDNPSLSCTGPCNSMVLWDGFHCGNTTSNTPWFYKQLPQPTTDDIEMRVCRDEHRNNEDIGIEVIELYIQ